MAHGSVDRIYRVSVCAHSQYYEPPSAPHIISTCAPPALSNAYMKEVCVHDGVQKIPGAKDVEVVKHCVSVIKKTTELATAFG